MKFAQLASLACACLLGCVLAWRAPWAGAAGLTADIVVFESPSTWVLHNLAEADGIVPRWVTPGIVVAEGNAPASWGGRVVARRPADQELALLWARDAEALAKTLTTAAHDGASRFLAAHRVAALTSAAGEVWLLVAPAGSWPAEALGCHGGLVLPPARVDPRSLIDDGPPPALAGWVNTPGRPWTIAEQRLAASVSIDTLQAYMEALIRPFPGLPLLADRWSFGGELDSLFNPRLQGIMQRHLEGIPGAQTALQPFDMVRVAPSALPDPAVHDTVTTHNVIAHLPGTVPGTGTFVVGGHIDATGSRNTSWESARVRGASYQTPGAEDNASGVACVLETLRCLADAVRAGEVAFAFDLEFVAFSGEEIWDGQIGERGLLGSKHYVQERVAQFDSGDADKRLLGVLNLDMVGSDSLGGRLQLGYNPGSHWLVELAQDAITGLSPPLSLSVLPELDTAIASDHNSFWAVNVDGLFAVDAPVNVLRQYATYHRPSDDGRDVDFNQMSEVTRAVLAVLLRFNVKTQTQPDILFPPERLALTYVVRGLEVPYNRFSEFHPLFPGAPFRAHLSLYNVGARYNGPLRVEMWSEQRGVQRSLYDDLRTVDVSTGQRLDYELDPISISAGDVGEFEFHAQVTTQGALGSVVQAAVDTFAVAPGAASGPMTITVLRNPAPSLAEATLEFVFAEERGTLEIEVYNLEGERLSRRRETVRESPGNPVKLPVLPEARGDASGAYLVRTIWRGQSGASAEAVRRIAVLR